MIILLDYEKRGTKTETGRDFFRSCYQTWKVSKSNYSNLSISHLTPKNYSLIDKEKKYIF